MRMIVTFIFGLLLISSAQLLAASDMPPLTASELSALLSGNSMAGNGKENIPADPYDWIAFYDANGTISMRLKPEWGGATDSGKWWITDSGELCRQFKKMASGKEGCWLVHREGEFIRFIPSQGTAFEGRAAIIEGNFIEATK